MARAVRDVDEAQGCSSPRQDMAAKGEITLTKNRADDELVTDDRPANSCRHGLSRGQGARACSYPCRNRAENRLPEAAPIRRLRAAEGGKGGRRPRSALALEEIGIAIKGNRMRFAASRRG